MRAVHRCDSWFFPLVSLYFPPFIYHIIAHLSHFLVWPCLVSSVGLLKEGKSKIKFQKLPDFQVIFGT